MEFRIVDTEILLKNFKPYHKSMEKINAEKAKFSDKVDSIRTEMETIVKTSQLIHVGEKTMEEKAQRFKELQAEAMELENEFRQMISKMQNEELDKNFREVSDIIQQWASENKVSHVFNKLQLAYTDESANCTDEVIEMFKTNDLYEEFSEEKVKLQES
jgi:Skp family chaperone for outer membrane proteins